MNIKYATAAHREQTRTNVEQLARQARMKLFTYARGQESGSRAAFPRRIRHDAQIHLNWPSGSPFDVVQ